MTDTPTPEEADLLASWIASRALKAGLPPPLADTTAQALYKDTRDLIQAAPPQEDTP